MCGNLSRGGFDNDDVGSVSETKCDLRGRGSVVGECNVVFNGDVGSCEADILADGYTSVTVTSLKAVSVSIPLILLTLPETAG